MKFLLTTKLSHRIYFRGILLELTGEFTGGLWGIYSWFMGINRYSESFLSAPLKLLFLKHILSVRKLR